MTLVSPSSSHVQHGRSHRRLSVGAAVLGVLALACGTLALGAPAASATTPAQLQKQEWWIGALGLEIKNSPTNGAWQLTRGAGVTVAVIDEGVDTSVADLSDATVTGFTVGGSGSPNQAHDTDGHGTAMAVDIAGRGKGPGILGVAPQSKILPVYLAGDPQQGTVDALTRLTGMADPPAIVSMSYGSTSTSCPADVQAAVKQAVDKGLILVASAGNSGNAGNPSQFPANCKGVVATGAFDTDAKPWDGSQRQPYVSIGGPGVDIVGFQRDGTLGTSNGTSDAAAIVAGELALLRAHFTHLTPRQLVARLFATTSKLYSGPGFGQRNDVLGYGPAVVNRALRQNVSASAANPVYDQLAAVTTTPSSSTPTGSSSSAPGSTAASASPTTPHGDVTEGFPGSSNSAGGSGSSSGSGVIIGIVLAVVVIIAIIVAVVARRRRGASRAGGVGGYRS